ncbi:MAG: hypothetical protein QOF14_756 [Hyphomicrobiales bacterium]|jgi:hypothetical protein|nr:hypothetical protein [Hyphomicrobiales bacterium]
MTKEKLGKYDLAEIVKEHLGIEALSVTVLSDTVYGWNAFAMNTPENEPDIHAKMQRAVEELRKRYELQVA